MFYEFRQNNSGGHFDEDTNAGISAWVIVEADSLGEAEARAESIGLYFDGVEKGYDCECCGDRWYSASWSGDGTVEPEVYGRRIEDGRVSPAEDKGYFTDYKWMKGPEGYIHYKDGRIEGFDY
jgi:hypothetical protein